MSREDVKFTYHDYLLLSDEKRYELIDGELYVVPAPNIYHQRISRNLEYALVQHVRQNNLGEVLNAPCDVVLSQENVIQPDILFISKDRFGIIATANIQAAPDLVIEILSESTKARDLDIKRKLYARYGAREYWIVDPTAKSVEVLAWRQAGYEPGYVTVAVLLHTASLSSPLFPQLNLPLSDIFPSERQD